MMDKPIDPIPTLIRAVEELIEDSYVDGGGYLHIRESSFIRMVEALERERLLIAAKGA